ncbi:MAG: glycogen-binding domain-containing protein [Phycisphaerales bacterium]
MKGVKTIRRAAVRTKTAIKKRIAKPYGVKKVRGGVVFTAFYPNASSVHVAGDFNGWQPQLTPMNKIDEQGVWQIKIPLTAGSYRYRFVVDGQWQHDPNNTTTELNPYGELNSVLQINK